MSVLKENIEPRRDSMLTKPITLATPIFKSRIRMVVSLILACFSLQPIAAQENVVVDSYVEVLEGFDDDIKQMRAVLKVVPGMAVGVVRDGKVLFAKGFGYRDIEKQLPVTLETQFYIASVTKGFVAASARMLADAEQIDLEESLEDYLPELKFATSISAKQISLRDLLVHRSGLENDLVVYSTSYTGNLDRDGLFKQLRRCTASDATFNYTNLGYIIGALAMESTTDRTWQEIVHQQLLEPLELTDTGFSLEAVSPDKLAIPYAVSKSGFERLAIKRDNVMNAAGGMVSSLDDMLKWLAVFMQRGKYQGKQIFSRNAFEEILAPQISVDGGFYGFKRHGYSLGWYLGSYESEPLNQCFGSYAGYRTHVSFMPDRNIGVVVLSNEGRDGVFMPDIVAQNLYDRFLQKPDRAKRWSIAIDKYKQLLPRLRSDRERFEVSGRTFKPASNLDEYAGVYSHDLLGALKITIGEAELSGTFGNLSAPLVSRSGDTFTADWLAGAFVQPETLTFVRGATGAVERLMATISGETYEFEKADDDSDR